MALPRYIGHCPVSVDGVAKCRQMSPATIGDIGQLSKRSILGQRFRAAQRPKILNLKVDITLVYRPLPGQCRWCRQMSPNVAGDNRRHWSVVEKVDFRARPKFLNLGQNQRQKQNSSTRFLTLTATSPKVYLGLGASIWYRVE